MAAFASGLATRIPLHHVFSPSILPTPVPVTPPPLLLLFIHGLDSSSTTWSPFLNIDEDKPYHRSFPSYAVDLRGHGQSPLSTSSEFSPEAIVDDLTSFLSNIAVKPPFDPVPAVIPKVVVVGHSMGGRIAMLLAAKLAGALEGSLPFELSKVIIEVRPQE